MNTEEDTVPQGQQLDISELFATIGEYEMTKRLMANEIQRLTNENAELKKTLEEKTPKK